MYLYITHHGQTPSSVQKRFQGWGNDPLTRTGILQAQALSGRLADEDLTAVISSDLERAYDTAAAIATPHGLDVQVNPNLRAVNMGEWEGRIHADVRREEADLFERWLEDPTQYYPNGGESLFAVRDRIAQALADCQQCYPTTPREPEPVIVWVSHTTTIGVMICHLLGLPLQMRRNFHTGDVCLSEFHLLGERGLVVRSLNDTSHVRNRPNLSRPSHGAYLYIK